MQAVPPVAAVHAAHGMVVAQEARAARIGVDILRQGGNAVDAAVATGFALAVTYPRAGNLGGGGFMVIHRADGENIAIDYRETAPAAAGPTMFLDADGNIDSRKSRSTGLAVGVPGTVAGLALAHQRYGSGRFTLAQLIAPALALARDGIAVDGDLADSLPRARERLARWPSSAAIFLNADGSALRPGQRLVQSDLAATLETVARDGPRAFYDGPIAERIAAAVREAGGTMTAADLRGYEARLRAPVSGTYRGYTVLSMPPPSSGGVHLIEILNILEGFALHDDARTRHLMIEAMKRAYADRAAYLGDPDQVTVPVAGLISKRYAASLRAEIDPEKATPASSGNPVPHEGDNTTHFSVVDRDGNAVSNTYTLNFSYGVGLVAAGTGVLLNNEMDDFTARPGATNAFGLVGFEPNLPAPGKRPLSSMTPTILLKDGRVALVTGSPGGSRIITAVLQQIVNIVDFGMDVAASIEAPRLHHQWQPDEVVVEPMLPAATRQALERRGHRVVVRRPATEINAIVADGAGGWVGAADTRTRDALAAGY
ncbi:MAG TPA: gamma-glutamyltransferase [Pseudolabrys sp.]|nr:gamma-glutamyltransferase [Pseudolabrys sp.]